jgi:thiosulfate dehydrogenase [quinone] large subunit
MAMPAALAVVGLALMLGLFTRAACVGALVLLGLFYLSALPTAGVPQPGAEGAYLLVNKNLIEAAAVAVLLSFHTGRIAGLDLLRARSSPVDVRSEAA